MKKNKQEAEIEAIGNLSFYKATKYNHKPFKKFKVFMLCKN